MIRTLVCAVLLVVVGMAEAGTIEVYNTGVDDTGNVLAAGASDPHWSILSGPGISSPIQAKATDPYAPYWLPTGSDPQSMWVNPSGNADAYEPGTSASYFVYETSFDLTGLIPSTASLSFGIAVDDDTVDMKLNGTSLGNLGAPHGTWGFNRFTPVTISEGFVSGVNTLSILISNWTGGLGSPHGMRIEFTSATAEVVPLPSAAWLGLGLLGALGLARRLKRRHV